MHMSQITIEIYIIYNKLFTDYKKLVFEISVAGRQALSLRLVRNSADTRGGIT